MRVWCKTQVDCSSGLRRCVGLSEKTASLPKHDYCRFFTKEAMSRFHPSATTVLASSVRGEHSEAESQILHELFRQVVGPIVILQDPLSVASLAKLLGKDVATLKRTLSNLHSVLDVPVDESNTVRLLHPSFRDFLLNQSRCPDHVPR